MALQPLRATKKNTHIASCLLVRKVWRKHNKLVLTYPSDIYFNFLWLCTCAIPHLDKRRIRQYKPISAWLQIFSDQSCAKLNPISLSLKHPRFFLLISHWLLTAVIDFVWFYSVLRLIRWIGLQNVFYTHDNFIESFVLLSGGTNR